MKRAAGLAVLLALLAVPAGAHVAFSSVELRVTARSVDVTIVAQAYDLAHELGVDPPERLEDLAFLSSKRDGLAKLMDASLTIQAGSDTLVPSGWDMAAAAPDQQLIRMRASYPLERPAASVTIVSRLFAYDTAHQTLVTILDGDAVATQQLLDASRASYTYFTVTRAALRAIVRAFARAGLQRALTAADHLLFLAAIVLIGGAPKRIGAVLTAFVVSCTIAFAAATRLAVTVPPYIVAPGVALSVVYAGVDNVLMRDGRDVRVWVALAFGWLHGLSLAAAMNVLDRPVHGAGWAAAAFGTGAEAGLLLAAIAVASISASASQAAPQSRRAWTTAVSLAIAIAGVAVFIRRLMSP